MPGCWVDPTLAAQLPCTTASAAASHSPLHPPQRRTTHIHGTCTPPRAAAFTGPTHTHAACLGGDRGLPVAGGCTHPTRTRRCTCPHTPGSYAFTHTTHFTPHCPGISWFGIAYWFAPFLVVVELDLPFLGFFPGQVIQRYQHHTGSHGTVPFPLCWFFASY